MAHLPLLFDAQTKLNAIKGPMFGNRVISHKVLSNLLEMKDFGLYDVYRKEVVETAINLEITQRVLPYWMEIQA